MNSAILVELDHKCQRQIRVDPDHDETFDLLISFRQGFEQKDALVQDQPYVRENMIARPADTSNNVSLVPTSRFRLQKRFMLVNGQTHAMTTPPNSFIPQAQILFLSRIARALVSVSSVSSVCTAT